MLWIPSILVFLLIVNPSPVIVNHIVNRAEAYNLPVNIVMSVAICESKLNPAAYNPLDTDGLEAFGLWQFKENTFAGEDINDWREQTEVALQMMKKDLWLKWPTCFKKAVKALNDYNNSI